MESQDFSLYSGDSRKLKVEIKDESGAFLNLTGAKIIWAIIDNFSVVVSKGNTPPLSGISVTEPLNGACSIELLSTDTENLVGSFRHEARVIDAEGNSSLVFYGTVMIEKSYV